MPDILDALVDNLNGGGQAGDGLELPEEPEEDGGGGGNLLKPAAALAGAKSLLSDKGDEGKAVGEVEGRRMVVRQPENEGSESLAALASAATTIALLGLPAKAVTTAVGSKL